MASTKKDIYTVDWFDFSFGYTKKRHSLIGRGSFSSVYVVQNRHTEIFYACKDILKTEDSACHIAREAVALRRLSHHYVIQMHRVTENHNKACFLLELAVNNDLMFWIHEQFPDMHALHIDCVRFYAAEVLVALEYLRSQHFVHRDIKSDNILLDANFHIKLCDFGAAKKINEEQGWTILKFLKQKNDHTGDPLRAAPEVWYKGPVTYSTDLWGLGYLIFDMYAGGPICWQKYSLPKKTVYERIQCGMYPWPQTCPRPDVVDVVQKLTRRDPKDRIGADDFQPLKAHKFFEGINFDPEILRRTKPPTMKATDELPPRPQLLNEALPHIPPSQLPAQTTTSEATEVRRSDTLEDPQARRSDILEAPEARSPPLPRKTFRSIFDGIFNETWTKVDSPRPELTDIPEEQECPQFTDPTISLPLGAAPLLNRMGNKEFKTETIPTEFPQ